MKPLFLTEEDIIKIKEEFDKHIGTRMMDGTFSFSKKYYYENKTKEKAYLYFTPEAYLKMLTLVDGFSTEVAWHGCVKRLPDPNKFQIFDIVVYPQRVNGAYVDMDVDKYGDFLYHLTPEQMDNLYCQGHSHVNMGTSPSGKDLESQMTVLDQQGHQGFYIFMIWNKRNEHTIFIYDLENNVYYENGDIEVGILDSTYGTTSDFLNEMKKIVVSNVVYSPQTTPQKKEQQKPKAEPKKKEPWYMNGDKKKDGEKDYDKEIFQDDEDDNAYGSWGSGWYWS